MSLSEFELINKYFRNAFNDSPDVKCGIGDDAAIISLPKGMDLVVTMDTLAGGIHFPDDATAEDIGYKSLAVNLSDLAAMGADPQWFTLALTLPENDETWLQCFMTGMGVLARQYKLSLVGGDLTRGPLSITIQMQGHIPAGKALFRHGAEAGNLVYVSGTLGDAGLALLSLEKKYPVAENDREAVMQRLNWPVPRIELGMALRGIATSAIDISDGLLADLGHILESGSMGAEILLDKLPRSEALAQLPDMDAWELMLTSGDDYELCFTIPVNSKDQVEKKLSRICPLRCIGTITDSTGIKWLQPDGREFSPAKNAYTHF